MHGPCASHAPHRQQCLSPRERWRSSTSSTSTLIFGLVSPHQHLSRLAQPLQRPRRPEHYDITVFKMTGHDALQGMSSHHGRSSATRTRSSQARPSSRGRARHKGEKNVQKCTAAALCCCGCCCCCCCNFIARNISDNWFASCWASGRSWTLGWIQSSRIQISSIRRPALENQREQAEVKKYRAASVFAQFQ
jgi:hypothetical protein